MSNSADRGRGFYAAMLGDGKITRPNIDDFSNSGSLQMNRNLHSKACLAFVICLSLAQEDLAVAATKSQRCEAYARHAARYTPTHGGPVRGAIVGGAIGSFGAAAGAGAAIGAGVGLVRRAAQRSRAYEYYYHRCMGY
jgi:hypothetical protein